MKKAVAALSVGLCVILGLSVIAGCSNNRGTADTEPFVDDYIEGKEYNLSFFGWGDDKEQNIYRELINDFTYLYPNIHVDYSATAAGEYNIALTGKLKNLPDVFYLADTEFLQWADSGRLLNLIDAEKKIEAELADVWDNGVNEYYYNPTTYRLGKSEGAGLYALPKDQGPYTLGYNKNLVNERISANRLENDEEVKSLFSGTPVSWEVFISAMKKLLQGTAKDVYGLPYYELEAAVYSNNTDFFDAGAEHSNLTSNAMAGAVDFIGELAREGITPDTGLQGIGEGADAKFYDKKSLMTFVGPWDFATIWTNETMEVDILPVPYGPGEDGEYNTADDGKSTTFIGSMGYCIPTQAKERGTAGAALRLAKFLCCDENAQRKFYALGQCVPNLKSMADEYINDTEEVFATDGHTEPEHRNIFIDIVNGFVDGNDKIGGKTRTLYYTYNTTWRGNLEDAINRSGIYTDASVKAISILEGYNATFQYELDDMNKTLKRQ